VLWLWRYDSDGRTDGRTDGRNIAHISVPHFVGCAKNVFTIFFCLFSFVKDCEKYYDINIHTIEADASMKEILKTGNEHTHDLVNQL
jgi:hypothetical protein